MAKMLPRSSHRVTPGHCLHRVVVLVQDHVVGAVPGLEVVEAQSASAVSKRNSRRSK